MAAKTQFKSKSNAIQFNEEISELDMIGYKCDTRKLLVLVMFKFVM